MAAKVAGGGRWEVVKKGRRPGAGSNGRGSGVDRRALGEANGVWKYDLTREYSPGPPPGPGPGPAPAGAYRAPEHPSSSRRLRSADRRLRVQRALPLPCSSGASHLVDSARDVAVLASQMSKLRPGEVRCLAQDHLSEGTRMPVLGRPADSTHPASCQRLLPGLSGQVAESWEEAFGFIIPGTPRPPLSNQQVG